MFFHSIFRMKRRCILFLPTGIIAGDTDLSAEGFLAGIAAGKGEVFNEKKEMKYIAEALGDEERIDIMKLNTYNQLKEVLDTNYTYQEVDGEMKRFGIRSYIMLLRPMLTM